LRCLLTSTKIVTPKQTRENMTDSIIMAIYLLCGLTISAFGILLTGFYYFGELTMPGVFAWVAPLMIPLGIVAIIVGEREAR